MSTTRPRRMLPVILWPRLSWPEWKRVFRNVVHEFMEDQLATFAGDTAFSAVIALFPALIAIISIYGLVFDPVDVARQFAELSATLPGSARALLSDQMREIVQSSSGKLGFGLIASLIVTLVAASGGMHSLIDGINVAYDNPETRSFLRVRLLALALTFGAVTVTVIGFAAIALLPYLAEPLGIERASRTLITIARWPALAAAVMTGLSLLYRYAPNRPRRKWHVFSFGAVFATLIWLLASLGFGAYASNFGNYNKTYGTLAGVVVLMMWLYISALAILIGAELNAELERSRERGDLADANAA